MGYISRESVKKEEQKLKKGGISIEIRRIGGGGHEYTPCCNDVSMMWTKKKKGGNYPLGEGGLQR